MLTSRSRLILEKSNVLRRNDKILTKCKLNEMEDQLMKPGPAKHNKLNDGDRIKTLRSSSLKNSTNKAVRNVENKKNSMNKKNTLEKFSENENLHKRRCKKQSVKQGNLYKNKSILKENNFDEKGNESMNLFVRKQKKIIKHLDLKDTKFKESNKSKNGIKSNKISINYHSDKSGSQRNINKMKDFKTTEADFIKCVSKSNVPIWKRQLDLNKSNCRKKRNSLVDVYDIALDEELIASEIEIRKKKICQPKKIKKKKRLTFLTKNQSCKNKHPACDTLCSIKKTLTLETDKTTSNEVDINLLVKENKNNLPGVQNMAIERQIKPKIVQNANNIFNSSLHEENTRQNPFLSASAQISDGNEILEQSEFDLGSTQSKLQSNKLLLDLADELEKSFMIPKMTSTPDGVQIQKPGVLNVANVSNISTMNKDYLNITVATSCDSVCKNVLQKDEGKATISDITLFESPAKKKKNKEWKWKSPKKSIQINLFGEFVNSPYNEDNLEESVLKPRKSYNSPDNFKIHLARTKKTDVCEKKIKKSKEELLIEKMTQHFEDVGDTELCIE